MCYDAHKASSQRTNLYISSSYKSPLLYWHCSPLILQIFCEHFWFLRLLLSASSGVSLSSLSLYHSLLHRIRSSVYIQHEQWTPPSINQLTCAKTVIYSETDRDINHHYTYQIWQAVIYAVYLSVTWTITHTKFGKAVIYAVNLSVTWTITHTGLMAKPPSKV